MSVKISEHPKVDEKLDSPKMYGVVILNDDYTTMDFVVELIMRIFNKPYDFAVGIMMQIHNTGSSVVEIYTFDVAVTKKAQVEKMAAENGFPLKADVCEAVL